MVLATNDALYPSKNSTSKLRGIFHGDRGYTGDNPNSEHWADLLKNDDDFREEFERIFNNDEIPETDEVEYTPDTLDNK